MIGRLIKRVYKKILEEQGYENIPSSCCSVKLIKKMKEKIFEKRTEIYCEQWKDGKSIECLCVAG